MSRSHSARSFRPLRAAFAALTVIAAPGIADAAITDETMSWSTQMVGQQVTVSSTLGPNDAWAAVGDGQTPSSLWWTAAIGRAVTLTQDTSPWILNLLGQHATPTEGQRVTRLSVGSDTNTESRSALLTFGADGSAQVLYSGGAGERSSGADFASSGGLTVFDSFNNGVRSLHLYDGETVTELLTIGESSSQGTLTGFSFGLDALSGNQLTYAATYMNDAGGSQQFVTTTTVPEPHALLTAAGLGLWMMWRRRPVAAR